MQTFLPISDFRRSLQCLDNKRLGKQRVEAVQIYTTLLLRKDHPKIAWANHPAVLMWEGYEDALVHYYNLAFEEWSIRGYNNVLLKPMELPRYFVMPPWFGLDKFHRSHQSNLLRKDPVFYGRYNWRVEPNLPYYWPVTK